MNSSFVNFIFYIVAVFGAFQIAVAQDIEGAADHPLVGRYQGSVITYYETFEYDEADLTVGKTEGERDPYSESFEGEVTQIYYEAPDGASPLAILRGFEETLVDEGFETLFQCKNKDRDQTNWCGPRRPAGTWMGSEYSFETLRLFSAKRESDEGMTHIQISAAITQKEVPIYTVVVVDNREFENKILDAEAVTNELTAQGKMAFYDIHFETGSANLKPDSDPTIALIAEVLNENPELKVVVVGHTDNEGTLDFNIGLSRERAAAVADRLTSQHGINPDRATHAGVAFLAPVTSNATENGRALNRRVEIVVR